MRYGALRVTPRRDVTRDLTRDIAPAFIRRSVPGPLRLPPRLDPRGLVDLVVVDPVMVAHVDPRGPPRIRRQAQGQLDCPLLAQPRQQARQHELGNQPLRLEPVAVAEP